MTTGTVDTSSSDTLTTGGVVLHTNLGDLPLENSLPPLQKTAWSTLELTAAPGNTAFTGRLKIQGTGSFGEVLRLTLVGK